MKRKRNKDDVDEDDDSGEYVPHKKRKLDHTTTEPIEEEEEEIAENEPIIVKIPRTVDRCCLVFGPTGSGKSSLLKSVCETFGDNEAASKFERGNGVNPTTKTLVSILPQGGSDPVCFGLDTKKQLIKVRMFLLDTPGLMDHRIEYAKFHSQFTGFLKNNKNNYANLIVYVMRLGVATKKEFESFEKFQRLFRESYDEVKPHLYLCLTGFDGPPYFIPGPNKFDEVEIKKIIDAANDEKKGNPYFKAVHESCEAGSGGYCFLGYDGNPQAHEFYKPQREESSLRLLKKIAEKKDGIKLGRLLKMTLMEKFKEVFCPIM